MGIEQVLESLYDKKVDIMRLSLSTREPNLAVYMTHNFFRDCMREIRGAVNSAVMEFYQNQTVNGYPVFLVEDRTNRHPSYHIVELNF